MTPLLRQAMLREAQQQAQPISRQLLRHMRVKLATPRPALPHRLRLRLGMIHSKRMGRHLLYLRAHHPFSFPTYLQIFKPCSAVTGLISLATRSQSVKSAQYLATSPPAARAVYVLTAPQTSPPEQATSPRHAPKSRTVNAAKLKAMSRRLVPASSLLQLTKALQSRATIAYYRVMNCTSANGCGAHILPYYPFWIMPSPHSLKLAYQFQDATPTLLPKRSFFGNATIAQRIVTLGTTALLCPDEMTVSKNSACSAPSGRTCSPRTHIHLHLHVRPAADPSLSRIRTLSSLKTPKTMMNPWTSAMTATLIELHRPGRVQHRPRGPREQNPNKSRHTLSNTTIRTSKVRRSRMATIGIESKTSSSLQRQAHSWRRHMGSRIGVCMLRGCHQDRHRGETITTRWKAESLVVEVGVGEEAIDRGADAEGVTILYHHQETCTEAVGLTSLSVERCKRLYFTRKSAYRQLRCGRAALLTMGTQPAQKRGDAVEAIEKPMS